MLLQVDSFDEELTEKACGVLFELIRITQQVYEPLHLSVYSCILYSIIVFIVTSGKVATRWEVHSLC